MTDGLSFSRRDSELGNFIGNDLIGGGRGWGAVQKSFLKWIELTRNKS